MSIRTLIRSRALNDRIATIRVVARESVGAKYTESIVLDEAEGRRADVAGTGSRRFAALTFSAELTDALNISSVILQKDATACCHRITKWIRLATVDCFTRCSRTNFA
jgi:hypothetical protein